MNMVAMLPSCIKPFSLPLSPAPAVVMVLRILAMVAMSTVVCHLHLFHISSSNFIVEGNDVQPATSQAAQDAVELVGILAPISVLAIQKQSW